MKVPVTAPCVGATFAATHFVEITVAGRRQRLEYAWVGSLQSDYSPVVFMHEGLGSLAMWRDYPAKFCAAGGFRGLVFSRYGYGQSTPRPADEKWPVTFMHQTAQWVLPPLFAALRIERPWLFGHSDGGSIALLYASMFAQDVAGLVVCAPHTFVEDISLASIAKARDAYATTGLRERLARYHRDPDSAFRGWNDVWLDPAFRSWNIEAELARITCPVLAVQGEDDEYGSLEQIAVIKRHLSDTTLLVLPHCGHSPHKDQPATLTNEAARFIHRFSDPLKPMR